MKINTPTTNQIALLPTYLFLAMMLHQSVFANGGNGNSTGSKQSLSGNGRFIVFESDASNLVPDDTNGARDIFLYDLRSGGLKRINVDSAGNQAAGGGSSGPSINFGGTKIAFHSSAHNLVPGDTNGATDVFVHETVAGTTVRVSVDSAGNQGDMSSFFPSISYDGRTVAYQSTSTNLVRDDTNNKNDIFVHYLRVGITVRASIDSSGVETNDLSLTPFISSDGKRVAFASRATNLVLQDTNGVQDIFVRDLTRRVTSRINVGPLGVEALGGASERPSLNYTGTKIAFQSEATNLVRNDTNGLEDIFVRDMASRTTVRASVDSAGNETTGTQFAHSITPAISATGTRIAFQSAAANLVPNDTNGRGDIFVRNLISKTTLRASVSPSGNQYLTGGACSTPSFNFNGSMVAFHVLATDLVPGDDNGFSDVILRHLSNQTTELISKPSLP